MTWRWILWFVFISLSSTAFVMADGPLLVAPVLAIALALLAPCMPSLIGEIRANRRVLKGGAR